jgi:hypothetical protein
VIVNPRFFSFQNLPVGFLIWTTKGFQMTTKFTQSEKERFRIAREKAQQLAVMYGFCDGFECTTQGFLFKREPDGQFDDVILEEDVKNLTGDLIDLFKEFGAIRIWRGFEKEKDSTGFILFEIQFLDPEVVKIEQTIQVE